jgi:uncharacterized phage infection (PIP) family protein YhgE
LEKLLLPIYYSNVDELDDEEKIEDEAIKLIKGTHWEDWRKLRLEDTNSSIYKKGVNRLSNRLKEIAAEVENISTVIEKKNSWLNQSQKSLEMNQGF